MKCNYPATLVPVKNTVDTLLAEYQHLILRPVDDSDELLVLNPPTIAEYVASCLRSAAGERVPGSVLAAIQFRWAHVQELAPSCCSVACLRPSGGCANDYHDAQPIGVAQRDIPTDFIGSRRGEP